MFERYANELAPRLLDLSISVTVSSLRILLTIVIAYIAIKLLRVGLERLEGLLTFAAERTEIASSAANRRVKTLLGVIRTIAVVLIWFMVVLISFSHVGINIGPILAGAGIVGLAVGFGAQNLVRDLVSGFFMILENQIHVGDVAVINGTGGLVENISFRTIVLRDLEGVVHVFPNGTINTLSNRTKEWSACVIDIRVAYKNDTDRVVEIMRAVGATMQEETAFSGLMLEPIEVLGVNDFAESAVTIRARIKTLPLQQWTVGREYRRRLKKAFDTEGIGFPFPHRTLYMGEASPPFQFIVKGSDGAAAARD